MASDEAKWLRLAVVAKIEALRNLLFALDHAMAVGAMDDAPQPAPESPQPSDAVDPHVGGSSE